jgi:hypothetical protein
MKILVVVSTFIFLFSCTADQKKPSEQNEESAGQHENKVDSIAIKKEWSRIKDSIQMAVDSLKEKFRFAEFDFKGRSYYHKIWRNNKYLAQQDMLIAGVDSIGNFFLVSNIRGGYPDLKEFMTVSEF